MNELPSEIYYLIVETLSRDDIKAMRLTCKETWNLYTGKESFWKEACLERFIGRPCSDNVRRRSWMSIGSAFEMHAQECQQKSCTERSR